MPTIDWIGKEAVVKHHKSLPAHTGTKVIYAAACRLGAAQLAREQIVFKQTPYALEV